MISRSAFFDGLLMIIAVVAVTFAGLSYFRPQAPASPPPVGPGDGSALIGQYLTPLSTLRENGDLQQIRLEGRRSLVLVFTSTCTYCEETAPIWVELVERIPETTRVVGVSLEGLDVARQWLRRHGLAVDRLVVPAQMEEVRNQWGATHVPLTLTVDSSGEVVHARYGVLDLADLEVMAGEMTLRMTRHVGNP